MPSAGRAGRQEAPEQPCTTENGVPASGIVRLTGTGFTRGTRVFTEVAYELARGNGATALVFNMHASVTGALGAVTEALINDGRLRKLTFTGLRKPANREPGHPAPRVQFLKTCVQ